MTIAGTGSADVVRWDVIVAPMAGGVAGAPVRRIAGSGRSAATSWNGMTDDGTRAPDGAYRVTLRFFDPAGNAATRSWSAVVDATPPALAATARPAAVSPDADGAGRHHPPRLDGQREHERDAADPAGHEARPLLDHRRDRRRRQLERPRRRRADRRRRPLHRCRQRLGRPREPGHDRDPPRRRPDGRLAPLGSDGLLPPGRRPPHPDGDRLRPRRPRGAPLAAGARRGRGRGAHRLEQSRLRGRDRGVALGRPHHVRDLGAARALRRRAERGGPLRHDRAAAGRDRGRVHGLALLDGAARRHPPHASPSGAWSPSGPPRRPRSGRPAAARSG